MSARFAFLTPLTRATTLRNVIPTLGKNVRGARRFRFPFLSGIVPYKKEQVDFLIWIAGRDERGSDVGLQGGKPTHGENQRDHVVDR